MKMSNKDNDMESVDKEGGNRLMGYVEMAGETMVVLASALWITRMPWVMYVFAIGAVVFAVGRLSVQRSFQTADVVVRRLLRQRTFAVFMLLGSAALMFARPGFYFGYNVYLTPSSWLVLFVVFVVIEVYTAFRLPNALKKS